MKKQDIDPEVFELITDWRKDKLNRGDDVASSGLMTYLDPNLPLKKKEKIVDTIIKNFPDLSNKTKDEQSVIFGDWRHATHINDHFKYNLKTHDSENHLLNDENIKLALKLADFLAQKTIEIGDKESVDSIKRVINAFMDYNWDQLKKHGWDTPSIMPKSFRCPEFLNLICHENSDINANEMEAFLLGSTIFRWVDFGISERRKMLTQLTASEWNEVFKKDPWYEAEQYLIPSDSNEAIERTKMFQKMLQEKLKGKAEGIFVDIDGTLFDDVTGDFEVDLYDFLVKASEYEKVTIFTGGDIKKQIKRLKEAGVDTDKFPVVSKDKYRGFLFTGFIIDDTPPENQGFIVPDSKRRYFRKSYNVLLFDSQLKDVKTKTDLENILEEQCLGSYFAEINSRAQKSGVYPKEKDGNDKTRASVAARIYNKRNPKPTGVRKFLGLKPRPDRIGAEEESKKFHDSNPDQKTALKFKALKKGGRG